MSNCVPDIMIDHDRTHRRVPNRHFKYVSTNHTRYPHPTQNVHPPPPQMLHSNTSGSTPAMKPVKMRPNRIKSMPVYNPAYYSGCEYSGPLNSSTALYPIPQKPEIATRAQHQEHLIKSTLLSNLRTIPFHPAPTTTPNPTNKDPTPRRGVTIRGLSHFPSLRAPNPNPATKTQFSK
jgi:hypothetical protein